LTLFHQKVVDWRLLLFQQAVWKEAQKLQQVREPKRPLPEGPERSAKHLAPALAMASTLAALSMTKRLRLLSLMRLLSQHVLHET